VHIPRRPVRTAASVLWVLGTFFTTGARSPHAPSQSPHPAAAIRLAITFDDLPWVGPLPAGDSAAIQPIDRIAAVLRVHQAPATGFVICGEVAGHEALLHDWVAWGNTLGNHSWSHHDLNGRSADAWSADVQRCDDYLKAYGAGYVPYVRFPLLHEGQTRSKRDSVHAALRAMHLGVAHVTVDNSGWLLAQADARAMAAHDAAGRHAVARAFVHHIVAAVRHADGVARRKTGRSVPQVLLLHANTLVAERLDALLLTLSARGVEFISLQEALADPAYGRVDEYVGPKGLSWLYRMHPLSVADARWDDAQADSIRARFALGTPVAQAPARREAGPRPYLAFHTPRGFDSIFAAAATSARMRSLLVMHRGALVAEAYFNGAGPESPANLKSVTKSLTATLVGVALRDGSIHSLDDSIGTYLPELVHRHPDKAGITIRELLTMSSGLHPVNYGAIQQSPDWVEMLLRQSFDHRPGDGFVYDTPVLQLLSAVLQRATGLSMREQVSRNLLGPIGAELVHWRLDAQGLALGGNDAYLRPRDLVRLGELYRRGGMWSGDTVLSGDYVRQATAVQIVPPSPTVNHGTLPVRGYGYLWWALDLDGGTAYAALGHGGQFVLVFPRRELVVVMTSRWPSASSTGHYRLVTRILLQQILPRFPLRASEPP